MHSKALNSSSFDKKYYNQLKIILGIKKGMLQLTNENIINIGDNILTKTEIINSKNGIMTLCRCFIDIASFYPQNLNYLIDLFLYLQSKQSPKNHIDLMKHYIVTFLHTRENIRSSALFFLRKLFLQKAVSYNSIIKEINFLPPHFDGIDKLCFDPSEDPAHEIIPQDEVLIENENMEGKLSQKVPAKSPSNRKKMKIIMWFYPEIKKHNKNFNINRFLQIGNQDLFSDVKNYVDGINNGYSPDDLARMIRKDDVDSFSLSCSQFKSPSDFDRTFTKKSTFDRFEILSHEPTFIQYASFFNAVKIFKYLMLNKADMISLNSGIYSLVEFAVCGGSVEIIHILEQNHFRMTGGILMSIESYQNDIFNYLLENFYPKSDLEFDLMDYKNIRKREKDEYDSMIFKPFIFDIDDKEDLYCFYKRYDPVIIKIPSEETDEQHEEKNEIFKFFNYDAIFRSIVLSNNLLALFILFDHGMDLNAQDSLSKRTLLHMAVQKGKTFLVQLLLSNKYIDVTLKDSNDEKAIVYSLKYGKEDIFFIMMNNEKITNSLDYTDYIKLAQYSEICGLEKATKYLKENWKFNLVDLIDSCKLKNLLILFMLLLYLS